MSDIDALKLEAELWVPVMEALACEARGEPVPEELGDRAYESGSILVAIALINRGVPEESVIGMMQRRPYTIGFTYKRDENDEDVFGLTLTFEDNDETLEVSR